VAAGAAAVPEGGLGAGVVERVARREPEVEPPGRPAQVAGQELVEVAHGEDVGEAGLGPGVRVLEQSGAVVLDLAGRPLGQEEIGGARGRQHHQDAAEVLVPGEVEEVVVLAEMGPRGERGVPEEDDRPVLDLVHERGPAAAELLGGVARPLGEEGRDGQAGQQDGGERIGQAALVHG